MSTFAEKPATSQGNSPAKAMKSDLAYLWRGREVISILHSVGDQAVQLFLEGSLGNGKKELISAAGSYFGRDASNLLAPSSAPLHIQAQLAMSTPGDGLEQEAARVADTVMKVPDSGALSVAPTGREDDGSRVEPATGAGVHEIHGDGNALTLSERGFMEPRFGADFSAIRVHTMNRPGFPRHP